MRYISYNCLNEPFSGEVDWLLVHNAGCTCDDTPLPHHVSGEDEIEAMMGQIDTALAALHDAIGQKRPRIITVAR